jgi:hypothetical protein
VLKGKLNGAIVSMWGKSSVRAYCRRNGAKGKSPFPCLERGRRPTAGKSVSGSTGGIAELFQYTDYHLTRLSISRTGPLVG